MFSSGKTKASAVRDSNFPYVTTLIPGDGTNGAQNNTFVDGSTNNFTITRNGNTTQGSFTPYGSNWSNYFDGSGDYLTLGGGMPSGAGTAFTIECWIYVTSLNDYNAITRGVTGSLDFGVASTGALTLDQTFTANICASSSGVIVTNTWYHVALTRSTGNIYKLWLNGSNVATSSAFANSITANTTVGYSSYSSSHYFKGFISNFRVVTSEVYTAAFTPPAAPLTAITNTSLLTCQSNRFIDNSTNAFAITVNGDTTVRPFSPFSPTAPYSTSTNGGSAYFDGSGDYLTISSSTAFDMTGDFTVEFFVYPNQLNQSNTATVFVCNTTSSFQINTLASGTKIEWYANGNPAIISVSYSGYLNLKSWNHIVACRTGTTTAIFVNGTRLGSATDNTSYDLSQLYVSYQPASQHYLEGYISGLRVIKGSGPYDATLSTLTVPTSPPTAITNTQLLCNFTDAGIFTYAPMVDYETVGNAQISTTSPKFGTGSMYFDGASPIGAFLRMPLSTDLDFGTGPFTIEFWMKTSGTQTTYSTLLSRNSNAPNSGAATDTVGVSNREATANDNKIGFGIQGTYIYSTTNPNDGNWHHIACVRASGTTMYVFVDGALEGSTTGLSSSTTASLSGGRIGKSQYNDLTDNAYIGYIDDFRITRGIARYTSSFTPPTSAFPTY